MDTILNISKKAPASKAKDFAYLKDQGIQYIQELAGTQWTDYNTHDPGITLLETLSYAINDLANRTAFDIKDLLAEDNGEAGKQTHFFAPKEILTTNPVSISDLRKVIIDVPGIKNAWLEPKVGNDFYSDGPAVHHNTDKNSLSYQAFEDNAPISLIGLYDVLLEFEYHANFGDLNSNTVSLPLEITDPESPLYGFKAMFAAQFPYWDDKLFPDTNLSHLSDEQLQEFKQSIVVEQLQDVDVTLYRGYDKLRFVLEDLKDIATGNAKIQVTDRISGTRLTAHEEALETAILGILQQLAEKYYNKVVLVRNLVKKVNKRLQQHRNLCEDFTNFKSLKVKEIALCIKVDLKHDAVPDKVLSSIFHALELFLAPSLKWCNLKELLNQQIPLDEIFEGPLLDHGFLTENQMGISDRRKMIYISDLINVISDITGVEFLGEIEIGLKNGREFKLSDSADHWHVALDKGHSEDTYYIPRLNIDHSNIRFFKSGIPLSTNRDTVNTLLVELRAKATDRSLAMEPDQLPDHYGSNRNVSEYVSIQSDLPLIYGIGEEGLPTSETTERKASAKQLKGYLLIFEQLLVNYLAQLKNVNQLFSIDTSVNRTYFIQDLYEVPNIAPLLVDFLSEAGELTDPEELRTKWQRFIEKTENAYLTHLKDITEGQQINKAGESESVFLDRRNRFLDHLMARFGEQVEDYANIMHSIDSDVSGYQLIEDKALLLKNYPAISANRGKGFDYTTEDTPQSGLEMRIARLLGIPSSEDSTQRAAFTVFQNKDGHYNFLVTNQAGQKILKGVTFYENIKVVEEAKMHMMDQGLDPENFTKVASKDDTFYFEFTLVGKTIARSRNYDGIPEQRLQQIMLSIDHLRMHEEQVLVVEHLLLRPKLIDRDELLPVYQITSDHGESICCPGNNDPYSFITSIVLPSWPARFRNLDFRRYVEERIRLETPAHIFPKICWVTKETMNRLSDSLNQWKTAMATVDFNDELFVKGFLGRSLDQLIQNELEGLSLTESSIRGQINEAISMLREQSQGVQLATEVRRDLLMKKDRLEKRSKLLQRSDAQRELIEAMKTMRNVYPTATLYDCQDSNSDNPIALNKTKLGTFKPLEDE